MVSERCFDWCFTSFKLDNYENWKNLDNDNIKYMVYQMECCPETGKHHIQGYIELKRKLVMKSVKKLLNDNTVHLEIRKGKDIEARAYCMKDESRIMDIVEIGEFIANKQGERNDLKVIYDLIKNGASDIELQEANPMLYARYYKSFDRMRNNLISKEKGKFRKVNVECRIGKAGSGKTKSVYDEFGCENVYRLRKGNGDNIWFDDYKGEETLLIDDFYGWIKYGQLLELLDGYILQLDCKGSYTYGIWKNVIITSNDMIDKWYKLGLTPALKRRINMIVEYEEDDLNVLNNEIDINVVKVKNGIKSDVMSYNRLNCIESNVAMNIEEISVVEGNTITSTNADFQEDYMRILNDKIIELERKKNLRFN